ncbi:hypothetical protein HID58_074754 [Brassica napus]|uniref:Uncharacterized protein n=2 Tax=Brassica napus TaxID=3708 RepID=A0ABQ7YJD2_BRANA|nr:hypothetical protein HID58_074754 [Brassica napus]CDY30569.1 BnaC07g04120D [Brassica napus]
MFSPLTKRPKQSSRNDRTPHHRVAPPDSPATHNRESAQRDSFISDRPATGTPARLGVLVWDVNVSGGMEETCLSWFIIGTKLFVWSQLTTFTIKKSAGAASRARSPVGIVMVHDTGNQSLMPRHHR